MTTPASGSLTFTHLNIEVRKSATDTISLNDAPVRKLAGVSTGAISMSNLLGKSYEVRVDLTTDDYNFDSATGLYNKVVAALNGRDFSSSEIVIVNSAILVSASSTKSTLDFSTFPWCPKLSLINTGSIYGRGGAGGEAGMRWSNPGYAGGPAITLPNYPLNLYNYGYIAGGGGGGGANNGYDYAGSSSGNCLSFDTYVLLYSGDYQLIQYLEPGDVVASFDGDRVVPGKVISAKPAGLKESFRITGDNFSVVSSAEHPFYTDNGYAAIDNNLLRYVHPDIEIAQNPLRIGTQLIDSHGRSVHITNIERLEQAREMYTIDIQDGLDNFYASSNTKTFVLTHNKRD